MRIFRILATSLTLLLCQSSLIFSKDITPLQLLFTVKQTFPDCQQLSILISKELLAKEEKNIARASAQTQIKATIYVVNSSSDIGSALRKIKKGSVMILFGSGVLSESKSRLYVLSKCKPKKIAIVTSSNDYAQSGALLSVVWDENQKLKTVLNLKHNEHLRSKFTPDFIQTVGIKEVIE